MALEKIKELITNNKFICNDMYEFAFFNRTRLTTKFCDFLSPDSKLYSSSLNPLFSFELDSSNKYLLKSFELISLRDGVLPLLSFFRRNPAPEKIDPIVVVDEELSSLVPITWRERVVLRRVVCLNKTISKPQNKVVVFVSPEKKSIPLEILKNEMSKLKKKIEKNCEVIIFFSSVNRRGEEEVSFDDSWRYRVFQVMVNELSGYNVRVLDWREYASEDFSGSKYFFINPLRYYFTDSFLHHDILQRGARPLFELNEELETKCILKLSACHGFVLHQDFSKEYAIDKGMLEYILKNEKVEKIDKDDYASLHIASDEFQSLAHDVSIDLYHKGQSFSC